MGWPNCSKKKNSECRIRKNRNGEKALRSEKSSEAKRREMKARGWVNAKRSGQKLRGSPTKIRVETGKMWYNSHLRGQDTNPTSELSMVGWGRGEKKGASILVMGEKGDIYLSSTVSPCRVWLNRKEWEEKRKKEWGFPTKSFAWWCV